MASDTVSGSAFGFSGPTIFGSSVQRGWNRDDAEVANYNSAVAAQKQMDFQERMSGTAHQRAVKDLSTAGLNPMLSIMQGAASTPPGAGFPAQQPKPFSPVNVGGTAKIQTAATINNLNAQTEKLQADTAEVRERTPTHGVEREFTAHRSAEIRQAISESAMRIEKIIEETTYTQNSAANIKQQTQNLKEAIPQIRQTVNLLEEQTGETKQRLSARLPQIQRELQELERLYRTMEMPGRETDETYAARSAGAILRSIGNALRSLNPLLPSTSSSSSTYERK